MLKIAWLLLILHNVSPKPMSIRHVINQNVNEETLIDDVINSNNDPVARFNKNDDESLMTGGWEDISRKTAVLIVRRVLEQGDILSVKQTTLIDRMVADEKLTCDLCAAGVKIIQLSLDSNIGEIIISDVAIDVCRVAQIEDNRVCPLAVEEFRDMFFYILFHLEPDQMCFWLMKDKCTKPEGFLEQWNLLVPGNQPPYAPPKLPPPRKPTTKFVFFTDMHMDVMYKAGASAECGEPLCCRSNDPTPPNSMQAAWKYGDFRNCDMPLWTVDGMMQSLRGKKIDFIFYTGDIPAHDVWNQTKDDQIDKIQRWTNVMKKYFPDTPVYAAVGNHESAPVNSYPPSSIYDEKGADIRWLYEALHKSWSNWIPEKDLETVRKGGFYSTLIRPGLRVVSLNTNYCSDDSWWLLVGANSFDPQGQLEWFINVMEKAEKANEKVYVITHRPTDGCLTSWSWNYYNVINRFQNIIIAQMFGHAHTDELKLYYDDKIKSRVASVAFIGPAVTTYSFKNSAYRIYTMDGAYDGTTNALLDGETYYLNMTAANLSGSQDWELEYIFSRDYGMKNLSPPEWQKLMKRFNEDDDLFQQYHQHITKNADMTSCDEACKKSTMCDIMTFRSGDESHC